MCCQSIILYVLLLFSLQTAFPETVQTKKNLPNVIMIMADDWGWSDITAYREYQAHVMGHDLSSLGGTNAISTPNLDRLCREGIIFTDAHSPAALCAPTRFSMMTGSNPYRNTVQWGTWGFTATCAFSKNRKHFTVGEIAQSAGYRTAFFGKMHFGGGNTNFEQKMPNFPTTYGFDYTFCTHGGIQDDPYLYFENDRFVRIDPDNPLNPSSPGTTNDLKKWTAGTYTITNGTGIIQNGHAGIGDINWNSSQNGIINSFKAVAFIDDHLARYPDRPFLIYYCAPQVHVPHTPPVDFNPNSDGTPHATNDANFVQAAGVTCGDNLADMVHEMDLQVGRILYKLEDPNGDGDTSDSILPNTLVMFTSDNGGLSSDRGIPGYDSTGILSGFKSMIEEGGHRVPFVAMWGDGDPLGTNDTIAPGRVSNQLICNHDWVGIIYALAGQSMASNQAMDCVNILPVLLGEQDESVPIHDYLLLQSQNKKTYPYAIRRGDYVMFFDKSREGGPLYNLTTDLTQTNNLLAGVPCAEYVALSNQLHTLFLLHDEPDDPRTTPPFIAPDTYPPLPDPACFSQPPTAIGPYAITMTAVTGNDISGPIEYLFTETSGNPGKNSSGWQLSPVYTSSGLLPGRTYSYTVTMRDALGHAGKPSSAAAARTGNGSVVFTDNFETSIESGNFTQAPYPVGEWHLQDTKGSSRHWTRDDSANGASVAIGDLNADLDNELRLGWGYDEAVVLYSTDFNIDTNRDYTFSGHWEIANVLAFHRGFIAGLAEFSGLDGSLVRRLTTDANLFGNTNSPSIGETGTFSVSITSADLAAAGASVTNKIGVFFHCDDSAPLYSDSATSSNKNDVYLVDAIQLTRTPDTLFSLWTNYYGVCDATRDPDHDGLNNLYEFAFGGDPTHAASAKYIPTFFIGPSGINCVYPRLYN